MKAKNFKPFNMTHESPREETCGDAESGLVARWQTRLEARPGYGALQVAFGVSHLRSHKAITNLNL